MPPSTKTVEVFENIYSIDCYHSIPNCLQTNNAIYEYIKYEPIRQAGVKTAINVQVCEQTSVSFKNKTLELCACTTVHERQDVFHYILPVAQAHLLRSSPPS